MNRKTKHAPVSLHPLSADQLPKEEIRAILHGAHDLIMSSGRTLHARILKGSRDKKILELELGHSPAYGPFDDLTIEDITARIDWLFVNDYLGIEYDYRLQLLIYRLCGCAIDREIYVVLSVAYFPSATLHTRLQAALVCSPVPPARSRPSTTRSFATSH